LDDYTKRGNPQRCDIPGYASIGSGSTGATYMMAWRELSPAMPVREALYYVCEGKYFGEHAGGVGTRTDLYIIRFRKPRIKIREKSVDDKLMKLCTRLEPRPFGESGIKVVNEISGKLMNAISKLIRKKEGKDWVIRTI